MRRITVILLPLCILYFAVGAVFVWSRVLDQQVYLSVAGVVGGIASVLGLYSLVRPALTQTDIQNIETESILKLGEVTAEIKKLEEARSETANQLTDLEARKKEMELLVRKASMSLFLREQYEHHKNNVLKLISQNSKIGEGIAELVAIESKLAALDEEISQDKNVQLLRSIIRESRAPSTSYRQIMNADPLTRAVFLYVQLVKRVFKLYN